MWSHFLLAAADGNNTAGTFWETVADKTPELVAVWAPKLGGAILLFFVFWFASRVVKNLIFAAGDKAELEYPVVRLMAMTARVTLLVAGLVTALGTLGVDVSALVAGLGLTGFALGFAVKDTISNILAGVLLLVYRPFSKQDYVEVKGMEGEVTAIDLRYTTLQHEGQTILLPNSLLFTNPITIGRGKSA